MHPLQKSLRTFVGRPQLPSLCTTIDLACASAPDEVDGVRGSVGSTRVNAQTSRLQYKPNRRTSAGRAL